MVTEELINYIKKEIEKGFPLESIKQQLLSQNISSQDIDEAIKKANEDNVTGSLPSSSMTQNQNNFYPDIRISKITNPSRFYAIPILGGLIKFIIQVPLYLMLLFAQIVFAICLFINIFIVLLKGKYFGPAYSWGVRYIQMSIKIIIFSSGLTNKYPGFTYSLNDNYTVNIPYPNSPDKLYAIPVMGLLIRVIMLIPALIFVRFLAYAVLFVTILSSFSVLFKRRYPKVTYDLVLDNIRITSAIAIYLTGMSDTVPSIQISTHNRKKELLLIFLGILIYVFFSAVSFAHGYLSEKKKLSNNTVVQKSTIVDNSIKCGTDTDCFFDAIDKNKKVSIYVNNINYTVEGIPFTEQINLSFDGYKDGIASFQGEGRAVDVLGNSPKNIDAQKTIQNIKDIAMGKKWSFGYPIPDFYNKMQLYRSGSCYGYLYPPFANLFVNQVLPFGAKRINDIPLNCPTNTKSKYFPKPTPTPLPSIPAK